MCYIILHVCDRRARCLGVYMCTAYVYNIMCVYVWGIKLLYVCVCGMCVIHMYTILCAYMCNAYVHIMLYMCGMCVIYKCGENAEAPVQYYVRICVRYEITACVCVCNMWHTHRCVCVYVCNAYVWNIICICVRYKIIYVCACVICNTYRINTCVYVIHIFTSNILVHVHCQ